VLDHSGPLHFVIHLFGFSFVIAVHSYARDRGGSWNGSCDASHLGWHRRARARRGADNATDLPDRGQFSFAMPRFWRGRA
jgi:hypothetical protein